MLPIYISVENLGDLEINLVCMYSSWFNSSGFLPLKQRNISLRKEQWAIL